MRWRRLIFWALLVFGLDQLTKWWVVQAIHPGTAISVIPHFFDLVNITNKGAAFGLFASLPDPYRFIALLGVSLLAVGFIFIYYRSLPASDVAVQIPLALILGGAAGNIFDRIFRGAVIDFLSFHWYDRWVEWKVFGRNWHFKLEWPAFNVADAAITCSVIILLIQLLYRGPSIAAPDKSDS